MWNCLVDLSSSSKSRSVSSFKWATIHCGLGRLPSAPTNDSSGVSFPQSSIGRPMFFMNSYKGPDDRWRSEEHTSELQSRFDLVCRLLLEKKNNVFYPTFRS